MKQAKLSRTDRVLLSTFPEHYQDALVHFHQACAAESIAQGQEPWPLAALVQKMVFDYFADTQKRDESARVAFEILVAPNFIHNLKARYEAWVDGGRRGAFAGDRQ